ncbi:MAG: serine/threonine protein kinase [Candidatus Obscuribacter sp.]|nr:serine/threonine protein kinase [Candidatus Obscuribacter sp.]
MTTPVSSTEWQMTADEDNLAKRSEAWQQFAPPVQDPAHGFHLLSDEEERATTNVMDLPQDQSTSGGQSPLAAGDAGSGLGSNLGSDSEGSGRGLTGNIQKYKDPLIGSYLEDRYHILSVLGWGGMSVVYKARQEPLDRLVAIKTVKFRVDERPDIWRRFEREIRTLSKLSHPNIVSVYDCIVGDDGQPYVVMDYLKGRSLDQVLQDDGRFSLVDLANVGGDIAAAVGHAHRHEVIHRDLKPANIMLVDDINQTEGPPAGDTTGSVKRVVKVVDFGLAKLGEDSRRLTNSGELWGSPPYMSPEQIRGGGIDHRADIYALGAVLYEMATGKDPFYGAEIYELLHKHVYEIPPTLKESCPEGDFPEALELVIAKALAKEPDDRFQSMAELKDALVLACNGGKPLLAPLSPRSTAGLAALPPPRRAVPETALPAESEATRFQRPLGLAFLSLLLVLCALLFVRGLSPAPPGLKRNVDAAYLKSRSEPAQTGVEAPPVVKKPAPASRISNNTAVAAGQGSRARRRRPVSPARSEGERELLKKNPPNSSSGPVKQTKFDILRQMKNPALRKEADDN